MAAENRIYLHKRHAVVDSESLSIGATNIVSKDRETANSINTMLIESRAIAATSSSTGDRSKTFDSGLTDLVAYGCLAHFDI